MNTQSEITIQNNKTNEKAIALAGLFAGILLTYFSRQSQQGWDSRAVSTFILGLFLSLAGIFNFLSNNETTTTIYSRRRLIRIENKIFYTATVTCIMFKDIRSISVEQISANTDGTAHFTLTVEKFSGESQRLFDGIYDHTFNKDATILLGEMIVGIINQNLNAGFNNKHIIKLHI